MATPPVDLPASLAGRAYLLAWDPDRQRLRGTSRLAYLVRAAALTDLYLAERLRDEEGKVRAVADRGRPASDYGRPASQPRHDVLLTDLHREITASQKRRSWAWWVRRDASATHRRVRSELVAGGWITAERRRVLGVVPIMRVGMLRPEAVVALRARVAVVLATDVPSHVDPRDAALVTLVGAANVGGLLGVRERRGRRSRLRALEASVGPVPAALRKVLRDDELSSVGAA